MYARVYTVLIFSSTVVGSNFGVYYGLEHGNPNILVNAYIGGIWGMMAGVVCPIVPFIAPGALMNRSFREALVQKAERLA
jgi:hypothetical protein